MLFQKPFLAHYIDYNNDEDVQIYVQSSNKKLIEQKLMRVIYMLKKSIFQKTLFQKTMFQKTVLQKKLFQKAMLLLCVSLAGVSASYAGNFQLKVGGSLLAPAHNNGVLAGAKADVSHEFNLTPSVEYFFGDSPFSAELLLAVAPFKHDIKLNGVEAATFKHLPPTITAKYHLKNSTRFTPYLGVGLTVAVPWDEKLNGSGSKLEADVTYGVAGQIGFNFQPADAKNWGVFTDVRYAQVESDVKLDGKGIGTLKVNPLVYTLGYSYRF